MPRRYFDYTDAFYGWNSLATYGSMLTLLSLVVFAMNGSALPSPEGKGTAIRHGTTAATIEWLLAATPANHLFQDLPLIRTTPKRA